MPKIAYKTIRFSESSQKLIDIANAILAEYSRRSMTITLRQLYYQFVARDIIPNKQSEYKRLGSIINDARLAGKIDWYHLQDRTRNLSSLPSWNHPSEIITSAARGYHRPLWEGQVNYVEVWIEKDALLGVIEGPCSELDTPYFSCRGYTSQSEMWEAAQRLIRQERKGRNTHIIHLGDHDPSGKDMSRDIEDRLEMFTSTVEVHRIALNMNQVKQYNPPPNPAKITDSRAAGYIAEFGDESWELDALDPDVMDRLIRENIGLYLDADMYEAQKRRQEREREILTEAADRWDDVAIFLRSGDESEA